MFKLTADLCTAFLNQPSSSHAQRVTTICVSPQAYTQYEHQLQTTSKLRIGLIPQPDD
jgi:hypothetical protein